jgi:FkbM family methyltransferase
MRSIKRFLGLVVLPVTRRVDFPGKRRLRTFVRLPDSGTREVRLMGNRYRLDLRESMYRDYYFGLCDQVELHIIRQMLVRGGDFIDAGASIGIYTVDIATFLGKRGRVLALEPNPQVRIRLEENVRLNHCENVIVSDVAVAAAPGPAQLYVPRFGDSAWASLSSEWVDGSQWVDDREVIDVEATTLDAEVARHGLRPAVVKIDVEGLETEVLRGAVSVLEQRPALFTEIVEENVAEVVPALARLGYLVARAGTRRLEPWPAEPRASNAVFLQPAHLPLLRPRERRAFATS